MHITEPRVKINRAELMPSSGNYEDLIQTIKEKLL
jgi:hypothetical protein